MMNPITCIKDIYHKRVSAILDNFADRLNRMQQTNLSTAMLHRKVFPQFKCKHMGEDIVIVATGPSMKKYRPIEGAVHIGVNSAFLREDINFDYLFAMDNYSVRGLLPKMNVYRPGECIKFYGLLNEFVEDLNYVIPESDAIVAQAFRYRTDYAPAGNMKMRMAYDLSTQPLGDCYSTVFSALQFALWTNPKRIYIVGCDCTNTGHFNSNARDEAFVKVRPMVPDSYNKMRHSWDDAKAFIQRYYPAIEIVSLNPVGLKGLFVDCYQ